MHFKQHNKLLRRGVCITLFKNVNSLRDWVLIAKLILRACYVKHGLSKI